MILFGVSLIAAGGNMALQSVLPSIGRSFELPDTMVAAAFAISALLWTVMSPVWARLSDRWGRKRTILIGMTGFTLSMAGFGMATTSGLQGWLGIGIAFGFMAVARGLYGLFGSAAPIASQAYVADRTSPGERTQAMSLLASAQGLGTVIGPALAPFLVLPIVGLAGPMYGFALCGAVMLFLVWRYLPSGGVARQPVSERRSPSDMGRGLWRDRRVRDFLIFGLLLTGAQAVNISVLGFHVIDEMAQTGLPASQSQPFIGVAMLAGAVATLMVQWGLIPLLRLQPPTLMRWGAALALAGNVLFIVTPGFFGIIIGYAVVSMGAGFARPGFTAGSSLAVGASEQGAIAGLMMSLAGLSFLGPPVIGVALYEWREFAPFVANGLLLAAALAMTLYRPQLRDLAAVDPVMEADVVAASAVRIDTAPASQPGPEGHR